MKKMLVVCILCVLSSWARAQYLGYAFKTDVKKGEQLYKAACKSCHGSDG